MTELKLQKGVPKLVAPTGSFVAIQNSMTTTDDVLKVSSSGNKNDKWVEIPPRGSIKFHEALFFMQESWDTFIFPVIEGS